MELFPEMNLLRIVVTFKDENVICRQILQYSTTSGTEKGWLAIRSIWELYSTANEK